MFVIIENGADPASPSAAELDFPAGPDVAYIPALRVPVDAGPLELRLRFGLDRLRGEWRGRPAEAPPTPGRAGLLVRDYRKAVARAGAPPAYLTRREEIPPGGPPPAQAGRLSARA